MGAEPVYLIRPHSGHPPQAEVGSYLYLEFSVDAK